MNLTKKITYRNRKLLDLAHEVKECQFRLPNCRGYSLHGCEPIHSDHSEHGKGFGLKAADDQHVAGCHSCHLHYGDSSNFPNREAKFALFNAARKRTFDNYERQGMLAKVGYAIEEPAQLEWE